jgi:hypothetical protein
MWAGFICAQEAKLQDELKFRCDHVLSCCTMAMIACGVERLTNLGEISFCVVPAEDSSSGTARNINGSKNRFALILIAAGLPFALGWGWIQDKIHLGERRRARHRGKMVHLG